jgi:hypothetical protein
MVWPEVTIQARDEEQVDCLLYALTQAGQAVLVRPGFCIEVGGARPAGHTWSNPSLSKQGQNRLCLGRDRHGTKARADWDP